MKRTTTATRIFLLSAIAALCTSAHAQVSATLPAVVEQAILSSPDIQYRFHNFQAATEERSAAKGAWLPRVDLEAATSANRTQKPSFPNGKDYNDNRASIVLRQTLFDGFATSSEVRRLSHAAQASYYELISASNQIAQDTAKAYLDVLRYRELVAMAVENLNTHREVYRKLSQKVAAGVGRRVDLELAAGRLALAESNWLTESSNLSDVMSRYQRLVGKLPPEQMASAPVLTGLVPKNIGFLPDAVAHNPDFLGSVATLRAYRADLRARKATMYPTVEFRARQSTETNQGGFDGNYNDTNLELVLNYNLYKGGSDHARIKQFAAKYNVALDLRDKTCRDVWQTGQIAYNDIVRLSNQTKLLEQHELSTSKARVAYLQQFDIGQRSLLDLLDTENEYFQARRSLTNANYDLQLANVRVLSTSNDLLKALKLRPISEDLPAADDGTEDNDNFMACSGQTLLTPASAPPAAPVADEAATPAAVLPAPAPAPAPLPAPQQPVPVATCPDFAPMLNEWIGAWRNKQFASYLSFYANDFEPALKLNRTQWETLRKQRLNKKGAIKAVIEDVSTSVCNTDTAEVHFRQSYGSDDYNDGVEKTLSLVRVGQDWKIKRETVTKGRTF